MRCIGKAYSEESRDQVRLLLQQDVAEDEIERQTGVSDRTIRRWKVCLNSSRPCGHICSKLDVVS